MEEYEKIVIITAVVLSIPVFIWLKLLSQKIKISLMEYYDQRDRNKAISDYWILQKEILQSEHNRNINSVSCLCVCHTRCCACRVRNQCCGGLAGSTEAKEVR